MKRWACLAVLLLGARSAHALNKQGARATTSEEQPPTFNLSGYVFAGAFLFNPSYAARPDNTGLTMFRFGLHLDADLYRQWLTLSYDFNSFTDRGDERRNLFLPTEHDHIVGLLSTIPLPHDLSLTLALHYEYDGTLTAPNARYLAQHPDCVNGVADHPPGCYQAGYSQSYADAYARLTFDRPRYSVYAALGGFVWNRSYASRPDNSGLALLRYVAHGEAWLIPSWLTVDLDFNFFTDRDEGIFKPTEADIVSEVALHFAERYQVSFIGEADLPIGAYPAKGPHPPTPTPGLRQVYLALMFQVDFDLHRDVFRHRW